MIEIGDNLAMIIYFCYYVWVFSILFWSEVVTGDAYLGVIYDLSNK